MWLDIEAGTNPPWWRHGVGFTIKPELMYYILRENKSGVKI
jgi:hypothetical protein